MYDGYMQESTWLNNSTDQCYADGQNQVQFLAVHCKNDCKQANLSVYSCLWGDILLWDMVW